MVYSLFDDEFQKPFPKEFASDLLMEGIESSHLTSLQGDKIDYEALSKLAIDYSDGVIQASETAKQCLIDYAKEKKVEFLPFVGGEDYADDYLEFYGKL